MFQGNNCSPVPKAPPCTPSSLTLSFSLMFLALFYFLSACVAICSFQNMLVFKGATNFDDELSFGLQFIHCRYGWNHLSLAQGSPYLFSQMPLLQCLCCQSLDMCTQYSARSNNGEIPLECLNKDHFFFFFFNFWFIFFKEIQNVIAILIQKGTTFNKLSYET